MNDEFIICFFLLQPKHFYDSSSHFSTTNLFLVVGCPWEGRNFAAVNRITYGNDMSIQCQDGYFGKGSFSFTAKCYQDGTWEDDARCIRISENDHTDPAGLVLINS